ncbi:MAG: hypothetical protein N2560_06700 [Ignavibacteria bacterium]|nr:hypothetical protein [Ignavibacteria bacterium]
MLKRVQFLIVVAIFCTFFAFAQNSGTKSTVLLKGRVVNQKTLSPIETKFFLIDNTGKKIPIKSSSDGTFSIPLSNSGKYNIQSDNFFCLDPLSIDIVVRESYSEKEVTLFFLPYEPGLTLKKTHGFDQITKELTPEGKDALTFISELNKNVHKLFFSIYLKIDESYYQPKTKTIQEGKKKKKITISQREQAETFSNELMGLIKSFLNSFNLPERRYKIVVEYVKNTTQATKTKKGKTKEPEPNYRRFPNLEIKIDSILKTDLDNTK